MGDQSKIDLTPTPWRQGELDSLCGLYAMLNAFKLLLPTQTDDGFWDDLFEAGVGALDTYVGLTHAMTNGCGATEMHAMLEALSEHLAAAHGIAVGVVPLFVTKPPRRSVRLEVLKGLSAMPDAALLTAICRPDPHWTVVRKVTARHLLTFDSSGHSKLKHTALARRSECTVTAPWAAAFMLTLKGI